MNVKHLDHLNLSVRSLDETAAWYERVFGFTRVEQGTSRGVPYAILRGGEALLCVYEHPGRAQIDDAHRRERPVHGLSHFALRITDGAAWEETVARERLPVRHGGVVEWAHSRSWYVTDPTGYEIEVVLWDEDRIALEPGGSAT